MIQFIQAWKRYESGHDALANVSFELQQGEMAFLTGHSGAGKSTLLHILGGLDKPDSGDWFVDGKSLWERSDRERSDLRNSRMGFIYQFHHLLPECTALENVAMP